MITPTTDLPPLLGTKLGTCEIAYEMRSLFADYIVLGTLTHTKMSGAGRYAEFDDLVILPKNLLNLELFSTAVEDPWIDEAMYPDDMDFYIVAE